MNNKFIINKLNIKQMKVKKFFGMLALMTSMFAISAAMVSCGGDDDDVEGGETGGGSGSASANTIVGSYTAITASNFKTKVVFSENGTGVITETEYEDDKEDVDTKRFTYNVKGDKVTLNLIHADGESEPFNVTFVDGFLQLEEVNGDDIEYVLYKDGRDLGKSNLSKIVGTWSFSKTTDEWSEEVTAVIKNDGTGTMSEYYKEDNYEDYTTATIACTMRNAYIIDVALDIKSSEGNFKRNGIAGIFGNKIYLFDEDGEVDGNSILTKKK